MAKSDLDLKCSRDGIGLRRNLPHMADCGYRGIVGELHIDDRVARCRSQDLSRDVEDRIPPPLTREPDDHLACLYDFAGLRAHGGDDTFGVSLELGEINLIVSRLLLRFRSFDLCLRR